MSTLFVVLCLVTVGMLAMALEAYAIGHNRGDLRPGPVEPKGLAPSSATAEEIDSMVAYRSRRHGGNVVGWLMRTDSQGRHHIAVRSPRGVEYVVRRKKIARVNVVDF